MKLSEPPVDELQADPRWQLVQRIVASSAFVRSSRLSSFLLFVSQSAIQGQTSKLNEQEIGVKIFGRVEGYLQSDDNIVRANASRLRQRLAEYFATEGQFETLRVSLPKGGYIPEFATVSLQYPAQIEPPIELPVEANIHPVPSEVASVEADAAQSVSRWRPISLFAILIIALGSTVGILIHSIRTLHGAESGSAKSPSSRLWATVFDPQNTTLVVPADSSLVLYEGLTHRIVTLGEYINGEYRTKADDGTDDLTSAKALARRRLTSIADLRFVEGVFPKLQQTGGKMNLRYARDLQTQDFRQSNVILLGARYANPWVSLLDDERRFMLTSDVGARTFTIQDHSQSSGKGNLIQFHPGQPKDLAYALVSFVPNFTQGKHVLILEGTSIAGTEAAVNFILESSELDPVLAKHVLPNGSVQNFELVLESKDFSGTPSSAKVIASRFW